MSFEKKITELGIILPDPPKAIASYIPANKADKFVFTSGQLPLKEGKLISTGKVGKEVSMQNAQLGMTQACLNALSAIRAIIGDLDKIEKIVKLGAFVSSENDFYEQHLVANAASDLLFSIFGESGRHSRFAIGVNTLPLNSSVELEVTVLLK
jgi:enamine deaminase RidA (YjgF/YER057c/UK114 family)